MIILGVLLACTGCGIAVFVLLRLNSETNKTRESTINALRGIHDSLVSVVGEMSRNQLTQWGSFENRVDRQLERLRESNSRKLDEMRITVGDKLDATLDKRLGDSFRMVSERLEQVYKGLGEMQTLAEGVGDLKKVFSNVKTRGTWGEVQLGALLEQTLAPNQYEVNARIKSNAERVEYAIRMPGLDRESPVLLPIDAKFPLEDYRRLQEAYEAGDTTCVEDSLHALEITLRTQAKRIHEKYVDPPKTTDFAILYLPTEGLYAEALRRPETVERIQREHRVLLTGPTTLMALLNCLQMGFRTVAIEKRSAEVWTVLSKVKTEFGHFADLLDQTQKRLQTASKSIDDASRKTRTIQRQLAHVQEMPASDYFPHLNIDEEREAI